MKTTKERIDALEAELQKIKKELETPTLEVGKWYKAIVHDIEWLINIVSFEGHQIKKYYGFSDYSGWKENIGTNIEWGSCLDNDVFLPATDKEVEEALIKEAVKRGFKKGVKIKQVSGDINILFNNKFEYLKEWNEYKNVLFIDNYLVFANGTWAEIIKDEIIKVGGYEVKKLENGSNATKYKIGCKEFYKADFLTVCDIMKVGNFKKVSFDGIETDLETINKILDL